MKRLYFFLLLLCFATNSLMAQSDFILALKQKATKGDASAQLYLGFCYENGNGVQQDYAQAVTWYRKAAEQGHIIAQYSLGLCYEHGYGVAKDKNKANELYRKAARQNHSNAQEKLRKQGLSW